VSRILLLLDHRENRHLLAGWLALRYRVLAADSERALGEEFDLGVLDATALDRLWERVQARKQAEQPSFLPWLVVTSRQDVGLVTRHLWTSVDELVITPIEKVELQARVEILLRARRLSLELRARAAELAEADRRKDEFLAILAHELRNPLAPVANALQIMRLQAADGGATARARDMAERQVKHLARLVDDLLDVSRITRGKLQLCLQPVELAPLLAHVLEGMRPFIEACGHELSVVLPPEPVRLQADPTRLEQVLANLLNNAAKYTRPGGRIWLTAERAGAEAVLRVRDNGVGIAPEKLPRVFDLFMQADRAPDHSQGGLGIGLTLVRSLAEMHGGTVQAFSPGLGRGSEFVVRLPALPQTPPERPEPRPVAARGAGRGLRVLVVDDNVDAAQSLAQLLALDRHEVYVAYDAPGTLESARAHPPEVVLLDIGLPGGDGYQVARRLREEVGLKDAVLVAVTGYGQEEDRRRSARAGFDHHLVKPVDVEALRDLLARCEALRS
jgi:signal transduction histidine kinase